MNWTAIKVAFFCTITAVAALLLFVAFFVPWSKNNDSSHRSHGTNNGVWRGRRCDTPPGGSQTCYGFIQPSTTFCRTFEDRLWTLQAMMLMAISFLILWCICFAIFNCVKTKYSKKTMNMVFIGTYIFIWIVVAVFCIMMIATWSTDVCHTKVSTRRADTEMGLLERTGQKLTSGFWLLIAAWIVLTLALCALLVWLCVDPCADKTPKKAARNDPYYTDDYSYTYDDTYEYGSRGRSTEYTMTQTQSRSAVPAPEPAPAPLQRRPSFAGVQFDLCGPKANDTGAAVNPAAVAVSSRRASTMHS